MAFFTPRELQETGEALYGPDWRGRMADRLGTTRKTVRCWETGRHAMPPKITTALLRLIDEQMVALNAKRATLVPLGNDNPHHI